MQVAIIKYNAGNVQSVKFALERLGIQAVVTDQAEQIRQADRVIFPGVGEASSTMNYLRSLKLDEVITHLTQPVLGICLGMQLMCRYTDENSTTCLGIFDEDVRRFVPDNSKKVPHMGWNQLHLMNGWIPKNLQNENMYFVHSYYVPVNRFTSAVTDYTVPFSAAMNKNNFFAVQFHPEKSGAAGEQVLKNFMEL